MAGCLVTEIAGEFLFQRESPLRSAPPMSCRTWLLGALRPALTAGSYVSLDGSEAAPVSAAGRCSNSTPCGRMRRTDAVAVVRRRGG